MMMLLYCGKPPGGRRCVGHGCSGRRREIISNNYYYYYNYYRYCCVLISIIEWRGLLCVAVRLKKKKIKKQYAVVERQLCDPHVSRSGGKGDKKKEKKKSAKKLNKRKK